MSFRPETVQGQTQYCLAVLHLGKNIPKKANYQGGDLFWHMV